MKRVALEKKSHLFRKGHAANPNGRKPGVQNTLTREIKAAIQMGAELAGQRIYNSRLKKLMKQLDLDRVEAKEHMQEEGGAVAYYAWLARWQPEVYGRLVEKLMPLQLTGNVETTVDVSHRYETVAQLAEVMKERGLPSPREMIDITPTRVEESVDE